MYFGNPTKEHIHAIFGLKNLDFKIGSQNQKFKNDEISLIFFIL